MTVNELYDEVKKTLTSIHNMYGDNVDHIEAYDGQIIIYFKREYVEQEITKAFMRDFTAIISQVIWGKQ